MDEERLPEKKQRIKSVKEKKDDVNYTLHTMGLMTFEPVDVRVCSAEDVEKRCIEYFEYCIKDGMKPTYAGLALIFNLTREYLQKILSGAYKIPSDNRDVLVKYVSALNCLLEDYMQNGKINPVAGIFIMKNNHGYKDAQEYVVNNQVADETPPEKLIEEATLLLGTEPKKANIEE